jgi:hypothetical protein
VISGYFPNSSNVGLGVSPSGCPCGTTIARCQRKQGSRRILVAEFLEDRRQHVTRLRVRGRDGERARIVLAQLGRELLDAAGLAHDLRGAVDDLGAGVGGSQQRATLAFEEPQAEFVLELLGWWAIDGVKENRGGSSFNLIIATAALFERVRTSVSTRC